MKKRHIYLLNIESFYHILLTKLKVSVSQWLQGRNFEKSLLSIELGGIQLLQSNEMTKIWTAPPPFFAFVQF